MKKFFTFISGALVCLALSAQDCPSTLNLSLVNGDDPSNVEIELQLYNSSPELFGYVMVIAKGTGSESVQWKKIGRKYYVVDDYLDVILANLESATGMSLDEVEYIENYFDHKAYLVHDQLQLQELLFVPSGLYFPVLEEPTAVGRFCLDMLACEDGEYELVSDHSLIDINMMYKSPENGYYWWVIEEPMVFTLVKQGDAVTEKGSVPARYVPSLSGIGTVAADNAVDSRTFDLQGHELQSVPEHGIYIQNGKKYVK